MPSPEILATWSHLRDIHGWLLQTEEYNIMYLFNPEDAESTLRDYFPDNPRNLYPLGAMYCGDILCIDEENKLCMFLHETNEFRELQTSFERLVERINHVDDALMEDIYE